MQMNKVFNLKSNHYLSIPTFASKDGMLILYQKYVNDESRTESWEWDVLKLRFTVSGIYQDITYGGKTAKTNFDFKENNVEAYNVFLDLRAGVNISKSHKKNLIWMMTGIKR